MADAADAVEVLRQGVFVFKKRNDAIRAFIHLARSEPAFASMVLGFIETVVDEDLYLMDAVLMLTEEIPEDAEEVTCKPEDN